AQSVWQAHLDFHRRLDIVAGRPNVVRMKYRALACDYDGTLAHDGVLTAETAAALDRFRHSGRKLIMVTGRELPDLKRVCRVLNKFEFVAVTELIDRIIATDLAEIRRRSREPQPITTET
ncbi:MAG: HAD family hydrolase, partial [Chthoniobacterales bacterium]